MPSPEILGKEGKTFKEGKEFLEIKNKEIPKNKEKKIRECGMEAVKWAIAIYRMINLIISIPVFVALCG